MHAGGQLYNRGLYRGGGKQRQGVTKLQGGSV